MAAILSRGGGGGGMSEQGNDQDYDHHVCEKTVLCVRSSLKISSPNLFRVCHPAKTQIIGLNCDNYFQAYTTLRLFSKLKPQEFFYLTTKVRWLRNGRWVFERRSLYLVVERHKWLSCRIIITTSSTGSAYHFDNNKFIIPPWEYRKTYSAYHCFMT